MQQRPMTTKSHDCTGRGAVGQETKVTNVGIGEDLGQGTQVGKMQSLRFYKIKVTASKEIKNCLIYMCNSHGFCRQLNNKNERDRRLKRLLCTSVHLRHSPADALQ